MAFKNLDKDNSTTISAKEIAAGAIGLADQDGNGHLNFRELATMVHQYAKFKKVKLARGWWKHLHKWYNQVNKGISLNELNAYFKESGEHVHGLKDAIHSLADKNHNGTHHHEKKDEAPKLSKG